MEQLIKLIGYLLTEAKKDPQVLDALRAQLYSLADGIDQYKTIKASYYN